MVRYPHTVIIKAVVSTIADGELVSEVETNHTVQGRVEPSRGYTKAKHPDGDTTEITAKFFTRSEFINGAKTLTHNGVEYDIVGWWPFQTHNEIWLD